MKEAHARIARTIEEYDLQGWHRTGTAVDKASADWLAVKLKDAGLEPHLETYGLERVEVIDARLEVDGRSILALPAFDGAFTDSKAISGRLGPLGSDAEIGVTAVADEQAGSQVDEARRVGRHEAIVAITEARRPGLQARNATYFKQPFGPPLLYVSSQEKEGLSASVENGLPGRAIAQVMMVPSESANVVAIRKGSEPDLPPLIVTTPRTGWWYCASERGGGIAAWLEVARRLAQATQPRSVWFVAFSGHELGHYGLDAFLERHPAMLELAKAWVHFGANVGGATDAAVRVGASNAELLEAATGALSQAGVEGVTTAPAGRVPGLEPQAINALDGRCISLLGGNAHFHLETDRWPETVNVASVALQASAFGNLVLELSREQ